MPQLRQSRHAFATAAVAGCVVAVMGTVLLAAAVEGGKGRSAGVVKASGGVKGGEATIGWAQGIVPPPGAALLLVGGLLAIRRGRRKGHRSEPEPLCKQV